MTRPPVQPSTRTPTKEFRFPCRHCGSDMRFNPDTAGLSCDHCGSTEDLPSLGPWAKAAGNWTSVSREHDIRQFLTTQEAAEDIEETRVTVCSSCAAQVTLDGAVHAKECPYCTTPLVADTGTHRHIKPQGLLLFTLDQDAALASMRDWLGRLWFAPHKLRLYARGGRRMQGIYTPFWTFDAATKTRYSGLRGRNYFVTVQLAGGKSRREQRTDWRPVSGHVTRRFNDILILGSKALPKWIVDNLQPWDLRALRPYQPEALSGFQAEGYTVSLLDGYEDAKIHMDQQIKQDIRRDIGGDHQRISERYTQVDDVTFKHILLPLWVAAYKYNGRSYRFVVNGQTGNVQGERPWSVPKILAAVILGLVVIAGAAYLVNVADM
jgi:DNA-directed RNA polymerase subunit RPC12/RpoP